MKTESGCLLRDGELRDSGNTPFGEPAVAVHVHRMVEAGRNRSQAAHQNDGVTAEPVVRRGLSEDNPSRCEKCDPSKQLRCAEPKCSRRRMSTSHSGQVIGMPRLTRGLAPRVHGAAMVSEMTLDQNAVTSLLHTIQSWVAA